MVVPSNEVGGKQYLTKHLVFIRDGDTDNLDHQMPYKQSDRVAFACISHYRDVFSSPYVELDVSNSCMKARIVAPSKPNYRSRRDH